MKQNLHRELGEAEQVVARVREQVEPRTWEAYWLTAHEGLSAKEAATRLGMSVAAVYMAKSRVGRMLREEGRRLQGEADEGKEI